MPEMKAAADVNSMQGGAWDDTGEPEGSIIAGDSDIKKVFLH